MLRPCTSALFTAASTLTLPEYSLSQFSAFSSLEPDSFVGWPGAISYLPSDRASQFSRFGNRMSEVSQGTGRKPISHGAQEGTSAWFAGTVMALRGTWNVLSSAMGRIHDLFEIQMGKVVIGNEFGGVVLGRKTKVAEETPAEAPSISSEETDPGKLYEKYIVYAERMAQQLARAYSQLGDFGRSELVDAALDGLLNACRLWDPKKNNNAKFTSYAFWYIKGEMLDRVQRLSKNVSTVDYEFRAVEGGSEPEIRLKFSPDVLAEADLETALLAIDTNGHFANALARLKVDGQISPIEEQIISPVFNEGSRIKDIADELKIEPARLKVIVLKLLRKVRVAVRDDQLFPEGFFRIPLEDLPTPRDEAINVALETMDYLRTGGGGLDIDGARPLEHFQKFLPDLEYLVRAVGTEGELEGVRTETARVLSFYRSAMGISNVELAAELGMDKAATHAMMLNGKLEHRQSPLRIAGLANTLGIDASQILFRAVPEIAGAFDRVVYAGDDVYLAAIDVAILPEDIVRNIARPGESAEQYKVHAFGDVLRAYRISQGISSSKDSALGSGYPSFEVGTAVSISKVMEMADKIGMPRLLAVLGTWPELLSVFDIMDSKGNVIHKGNCEYTRMIIVLNEVPWPGGTQEPEDVGLAGFARHLIAREGPVFMPAKLEGFGLNQKDIARLVGGKVPMEPSSLRNVSRILNLNPFEEMRLIAETLLAASFKGRADNLKELIELAYQQNSQVRMLEAGGWYGMEGIATVDTAMIKGLNEKYFGMTDEKETDPKSAAKKINLFLDEALELLRSEKQPEQAILDELLGDERASAKAQELWMDGALSDVEGDLVAAIAADMKDLFEISMQQNIPMPQLKRAVLQLAERVRESVIVH